MSGKLTEGFREIIDLRWSDFVEREKSLDATNFDSIITGLVRACKKGNLRAIQQALDRIDGKIAVQVEVEYPKFYTIYPKATKTADDPGIIDLPAIGEPETRGALIRGDYPDEVVGSPADLEELAAAEEELPTGSLRSVLERMLESPKQVVIDIIAAADAIDKGQGRGNPMVKSVIVAGLMKLVHDGKIAAVFEVFDQIDGKVADKYKVLGKDVFIRNYSLVAPAGAEKNADGIYQIAADNVTDSWVARLERENNRKRR